MSCVFVSVGQCGNQVLSSFFDQASQIQKCQNAISRYNGQYHCVCVDSETKVLSSMLRPNIPSEKIVSGIQGRGSNWAFGYHGADKETHLVEETMQLMRLEMEKCDACQGVLMFHSLAGGTGSGLSSRLTVEFRDTFGLHHLIHCAVAPHASAESPLQAYNQLLAMNCLTKHSDGIFLFPNDQLLRHCQSTTSKDAAASSVVVKQAHMNALLARQLVALLTPCTSIYQAANALGQGGGGGSCSHSHLEPWELVRSLCALPSCKLISCASSYHQGQLSGSGKAKIRMNDNIDWLLQCRRVCDNYRVSCSSHGEAGCLAALCVGRGEAALLPSHSTVQSAPLFASLVGKINRRLERALQPVHWNPYPIDYWLDDDPSFDSSLTLAFNHSAFANQYLSNVVENAARKYLSKAYLHWFYRHGCEAADFEDSIEQCRTVMNAYQEFSQNC